jgi:hypothetical protein
MITPAEKNGQSIVTCDGGCGRSDTLRTKKIHKSDYYICDTKVDGSKCLATLPPLPEGMVRQMEFNAASSFTGYSDVIPDEETRASVERAKQILKIGKRQTAKGIDRCFVD